MTPWLAFTMLCAAAATTGLFLRRRVLPEEWMLPTEPPPGHATRASYLRLRRAIRLCNGFARVLMFVQGVCFGSALGWFIVGQVPYEHLGGPWPWWIITLLCLVTLLFCFAARNDFRELCKSTYRNEESR